MDVEGEPIDEGWIDIPVCEEIINKPINLLLAVDGTEPSLVGLTYITEDLMQRDRATRVEVLHVYNDTKDRNLPHKFRKDSIYMHVEAQLTGAVSKKRYKLKWIPRAATSVGHQICDAIKEMPSDYVCIGFIGRKGKKDTNLLASNTMAVLANGQCSVICIKDETPEMLPKGRPTRYVVSVSLNKASTKAFLDTLRLSKPNDEIHVVYVKAFMERVDSDYTIALREKYAGFFSALKDEQDEVFTGFHDRQISFTMIKKQVRETIAEAFIRYSEDVEADFVVIGTNAMRTHRGKTPIGSVSLQILMLTERNFIVANWVDLDPAVYDRHVRGPSR